MHLRSRPPFSSGILTQFRSRTRTAQVSAHVLHLRYRVSAKVSIPASMQLSWGTSAGSHLQLRSWGGAVSAVDEFWATVCDWRMAMSFVNNCNVCIELTWFTMQSQMISEPYYTSIFKNPWRGGGTFTHVPPLAGYAPVKNSQTNGI